MSKYDEDYSFDHFNNDFFGDEDEDEDARRASLTEKLVVKMRWDYIDDLMFLSGLDDEYQEVENRVKEALTREFGVVVHRIEWMD